MNLSPLWKGSFLSNASSAATDKDKNEHMTKYDKIKIVVHNIRGTCATTGNVKIQTDGNHRFGFVCVFSVCFYAIRGDAPGLSWKGARPRGHLDLGARSQSLLKI